MIWQRLGKELSYVILFFCMNDYAQISISASLVGLEDMPVLLVKYQRLIKVFIFRMLVQKCSVVVLCYR